MPKQSKIDRADRIPVKAVIRIAGQAQASVTFYHNLSLGGLFIESLEPLARGAPIAVELTLPNNKKKLALACQVAWVRATKDAGPGEPAGMGLRFENLSDEQKRLIEQAVAYLSAVSKGEVA